jgi:hypothetical protein
VKAVKTRQNTKFKLAVNTWAYSFKYKSPSKFENVKEITEKVVACTQLEEYNNPQQSTLSSPTRKFTPSPRRPHRSHNPCHV